MEQVYFEDIHCAGEFYPYLDFSMENINYIAHFHEEIEIIYVMTGALRVYTESQELQLSKGDICFFMPGEIHSFQSSEQNHIYIIKYLPHSPGRESTSPSSAWPVSRSAGPSPPIPGFWTVFRPLPRRGPCGNGGMSSRSASKSAV